MKYTPFAGLTQLDENDPITIDGGSFMVKNPKITDQLLRVGAVAHRHDQHPALVNPHVGLTGQAVASGGTLGASANYALTYTVTDKVGGETTSAPPLVLTTGNQIGPPTVAPQLALVTSAGILPAGNYYYALTYTDGAGGETTLGPQAMITIVPGFASASVLVSGIAAELGHANGPVQWRLWRSYEGEDWHLAAQGSQNSYDDAGFDPPDNPARPPSTNNTASTWSLLVTLPTVAQEPALASGTAINLYIAPDTNFNDPCFYAQLPLASAGHTIQITREIVSVGSPPHVSTSIPGAGMIFPDSDIVFSLKSPVGTRQALPSGAYGDMRVTLDSQHLYSVLASTGAAGPGDWIDLTGVAGSAARGIKLAGSAGVGATGWEHYVEFAGSGGTGVAVQELGGGSARVLVSAPGGGGVGVAGIEIAGSGGVGLLGPETYIEFAGSGGIGATVQNMGGGSARVLLGVSLSSARARVLMSSGAQSIPGATWTAINWNNNDYNVGGLWDPAHPSRLTAPVTGLYLIEAQGDWTPVSGGTYRAMALAKNGATSGSFLASNAGVPLLATDIGETLPSPLVWLTAGDYVEVKVYQDSGSPLNFGTGAAAAPSFSMALLSGMQGPQGPAGAGGVELGGSAGVNPTPFGPETYIEFVGSGGTGVAVQNNGGGSARVLISAPAGAGNPSVFENDTQQAVSLTNASGFTALATPDRVTVTTASASDEVMVRYDALWTCDQGVSAQAAIFVDGVQCTMVTPNNATPQVQQAVFAGGVGFWVPLYTAPMELATAGPTNVGLVSQTSVATPTGNTDNPFPGSTIAPGGALILRGLAPGAHTIEVRFNSTFAGTQSVYAKRRHLRAWVT